MFFFEATDCDWEFPEVLIDKELIGGVKRVLHSWVKGLKNNLAGSSGSA